MIEIFFSPMSVLALTIVGLFASIWIALRTHNLKLSVGILYFTLLEMIQLLLTFYYAPELKSDQDGFCAGSNAGYHEYSLQCDSYGNKILTLMTFLHICFQPFFVHLVNSSLTSNCALKCNNSSSPLSSI
jgi:hypothetical protein